MKVEFLQRKYSTTKQKLAWMSEYVNCELNSLKKNWQKISFDTSLFMMKVIKNKEMSNWKQMHDMLQFVWKNLRELIKYFFKLNCYHAYGMQFRSVCWIQWNSKNNTILSYLGLWKFRCQQFKRWDKQNVTFWA